MIDKSGIAICRKDIQSGDKDFLLCKKGKKYYYIKEWNASLQSDTIYIMWAKEMFIKTSFALKYKSEVKELREYFILL